MSIDIGIMALRKALAPHSYVLRGKIVEIGDLYKVDLTIQAGEEIVLPCWAKPLLPLSFSYEKDDEVLVEVRSISAIYILGLAKELSSTDPSSEFYVRFGKNILKGKKDGTSIEFASGDGNFTIKHDELGTTVQSSGTISLLGDFVNLGKGIAPALNACTACPLQGLHVPTQEITFL